VLFLSINFIIKLKESKVILRES